MLEIFGYSALFCVPVLIPVAAKSHNNENAFKLDPNQTYEGFDNLAMGNVEVSLEAGSRGVGALQSRLGTKFATVEERQNKKKL